MSDSEVDVKISDSESVPPQNIPKPKHIEEESESSAVFKRPSSKIETKQSPEPTSNEIAPKINGQSSDDEADVTLTQEKGNESDTFTKNATAAIEMTTTTTQDSIGSFDDPSRFVDTDAEPEILHKDETAIIKETDQNSTKQKAKTCLLI